ncbi:hypothetical protein N184_33885 [Sinorhizobium sp. GL28]|nr:hypothetical protein N184_33885 [Sinorhizobium sp. GL28]
MTNWGCAYFAASSTTNPVKATGGALSDTSFNAAQAQSIATKDQFTGAYTDVSSRVLSLSVTGQTLRAVVQFKSTGDTARDCRSVALLSDNNVIAILSSSDVIFTIPAASTSIVGVSVDFDIVFTNTGQATVDVSTANTAMQSDLDRLVSCHVAGDPDTGEEQYIKGEKTFGDKVTFSTVEFTGKMNVENYFTAQQVSTPEFFLSSNDVSVLHIWKHNITQNTFISAASQALTIDGDEFPLTIKADKGIFIEGDIKPSYDNTNTLGGEDWIWSEVWANEVHCNGGFITADYLEASNDAEFTYNGFVNALKRAKDTPTEGTFQYLIVHGTRISTGDIISGGDGVKVLAIRASILTASGEVSLSFKALGTATSQKWVAVTDGVAASTPEWIFILAVRVP